LPISAETSFPPRDASSSRFMRPRKEARSRNMPRSTDARNARQSTFGTVESGGGGMELMRRKREKSERTDARMEL